MRSINAHDLFEETVEMFYKLVYKVCFDVLHDKFESENISQDTFLSLYKHFDRYSTLSSTEMKNLICRIALNKCKDFLKSKDFKLISSLTEDGEINPSISSNVSIEDDIMKKEKILLIRKTVNELKSPYKEVVTEYYINQLTLDEVSNKLGRDKSVVKMQLYRSKKILKENLEGGDLFG